MSKQRPTLAAKRRQKLSGAPKAKGAARSDNLWVVRLFDGSRTIVNGDLRLDHLFYAEGDPSVRRVVYPTDLDAEPLGGADVGFDAIVTLIDGTVECRHVRPKARDPSVFRDARDLQLCREAAQRLGGTYVEITASTLDLAQQRIQNWSRLLAAYRRCAGHPLGVLQESLLARFTRESRLTLSVILDSHVDSSRALIVAACAALLRKRRLASDLDSATWSLHTKLWRCLP